MPLAYHANIDLDLSRLTYNKDEVAVLHVAGGSYSGCWRLFAYASPDEEPLGAITTAETPGFRDPQADPLRGAGLAFDTAVVWVNDACVKAGVRLAYSEDRNPGHPAEERPYFMSGRFVIDRRAL